jgi:hypothetical protein
MMLKTLGWICVMVTGWLFATLLAAAWTVGVIP